MQTKAILVALAACSSVVSAGSAKVVNKCPFNVYLWSASPSSTGPQQTLNAGTGQYSEAYQSTPGTVLKISRNPGDQNLYNGSPLTQYEYTLSGSTVYYSLADTGGHPFSGYKVQLVPTSGTSIVWSSGSGSSTVLTTASDNDLTLTLCA